MSLLLQGEIISAMRRCNYAEKLLVTPLLSEAQIQPAGILVRLGSTLLVPRHRQLELQAIAGIPELEELEYDTLRLRPDSRFILRAGQFVLGCTFEYISIPLDLAGDVHARSSVARFGLLIDSFRIAPGWKGVLTLALTNLGSRNLRLRAGMLVAQLSFQSVSSRPESFSSPYYRCPTEPLPISIGSLVEI